MSRSQRAIELGSMFYIESGVRSAPARPRRRCAGEHCLTWLARDRSVFDRYCSACEHKLKPPVVHVLDVEPEPPKPVVTAKVGRHAFCEDCGERIYRGSTRCMSCNSKHRHDEAARRLAEKPRPVCACGKPCEKSGGRKGRVIGWRNVCAVCRRRRREQLTLDTA